MKISFVTLFPDFIRSYLSSGLLQRAEKNDIFEFDIINLRDSAEGSYKSVDDTVYGGSDGMLIQYEPLKKSLEVVKKKSVSKKMKIIYLSPQGKTIDQEMIDQLKKEEHLVLISGRYAGIDQRFISNFVDEEISIGDYVLSGGELPSLVLVEALSRHIDGVLGNNISMSEDSFANGLLEAPQFTKPSNIDNLKVPEVLVSGDHKKIKLWKENLSILVTLSKRKDLLQKSEDSGNFNIDWAKVEQFYKKITTKEKKLLQIENLESDIIFYKNMKINIKK